jgi:dTDP-glucose pyrophosphorylase
MVFSAHGATIRDSVVAIQDGGANISLAVDNVGVLVGIVTDGDVRRALLAGRQLTDPVDDFIQRNPFTVRPEESRTSILDLMQARGLSQVPVVDKRGALVGLHLMRELLGQGPRPNVAMVLAGGRGSRLMPMTAAIPKSMIEVAGRPILERILTHLVGFGIHRIALAVGYLSEPIEQHFGDGERFGCRIEYVREDPSTPLGTGGPLSTLADVYPDLADPVLVLNGDLITQFDVGSLLESHSATSAAVTIGVVTYTHEVPFGVLTTGEDGFVTTIVEKPLLEKIVSAGIYVFDPALLKTVPRDQFIPMTHILADCVARGERIATWNCGAEWSDVGRPQDLARARGHA